MLFNGKKTEELATENQESGKELNLIKLGFTVAGGVAATVAGVYVGKKLYQAYCNPLSDEVDCSNLPEEPLEEGDFNEVVGSNEETSTDSKIVDFSEVKDEIEDIKENQIQHELKDIFGPVEVGMSTFDAGDDFEELFSTAERSFQELQDWRRLNALADSEKSYIRKIKEVVKSYVASMFEYFEDQKRTDVITTINDLKMIVDDYASCAQLIVSFENGYEKFFDVTRVDESGVHYFISDMASDIQQTVQKFVESYPSLTRAYQELPSSGKILDTIKHLNDVFLTIKEDSFKKIHPISDTDTEYLDDISWNFSNYLTEFGVITNEIRNYIKSEECACFSEKQREELLNETIRREILYMNEDSDSLFRYFSPLIEVTNNAEAGVMNLDAFKFDISKMLIDLDTFIKGIKEKYSDINDNEEDFLDNDIFDENLEFEDDEDAGDVPVILRYIREYSNITLKYDKGSNERQTEIDMLNSICNLCDNTDISILSDSSRIRLKSNALCMIARLTNTDPKIFQYIRELMDLDVMNDVVISVDQMMNAIDSVFDTWDSVSKHIKESMDLVTDDDIRDIQNIKHQYRWGICNTIEELYDNRNHLYQIDAATEIIDEITEKLIHIFESFKDSSLLILDIFDSEEDKNAYADLRNQVDKFLRSEKGEDNNSSDGVSDNEETPKYEWNGGDMEVEPDEDSAVSETDVESINNENGGVSSNEIAATQELSVKEDLSPNKDAIDEFNSLVETLKKKMEEKPSEALKFYRDNLKCYLVDDNISDKTKQMLKSMEDKIIDKKYEKYENARKYMASQKGGRRRNKKRSDRK